MTDELGPIYRSLKTTHSLPPPPWPGRALAPDAFRPDLSTHLASDVTTVKKKSEYLTFFKGTCWYIIQAAHLALSQRHQRYFPLLEQVNASVSHTHLTPAQSSPETPLQVIWSVGYVWLVPKYCQLTFSGYSFPFSILLALQVDG